MTNAKLPRRVAPRRTQRYLRRSGIVPLVLFGMMACPMPASAQQGSQAAERLVPPELLQSVEPEYPASKRASGEMATVILTLELDEAGCVVDASLAEPADPEFAAAALLAAPQLVFRAATKDGTPVPARIAFQFEFRLLPPSPVAAEPQPELPGQQATERKASELPDGQGASRSRPPAVEPAEVMEIEIEGARAAREPTQRVLRVEEISKLPGTNGDALRAVTNLPGVARPPALSGELSIRGSAPRDTQVYFDGVSVPAAYHFGGVASVVPAEALESIDMYPGNFGPEYGRAMGGIIDVRLRSPRSDDWGGLLQLDLLDGRTLVEGPVSDSTRVLLGVRRSWVDAWLGPMLRSSGAGVAAAPVYYDYQALVEHDLTRDTTVRLSVLGSDDRMALTMKTPATDDPASGGELSIRQGWGRVQASAETHFGANATWRSSLAVGKTREAFAMGPLSLRAHAYSVDLRSDLRAHLFEGATAVVGVDAEWRHYDLVLVAPAMDYETGDASGPLFGRPSNELGGSGQLTRPAAYAMLELRPGDSLKLFPGVRVDYATDLERWTVDPRVGARYDLVPGAYRTTLKGGAGLFHQPPEPWQSIEPFGTPGVRSNRAIHYSVGVEQLIANDLELSVEGFYKDFSQLVVGVPAASDSASGLAYRNRGRGRSYGTESLLRYEGNGRFFGWLAYTLSRSERAGAPDEGLSLYRYDQTHILTALASYRLGAGWQLGGRFRYVTGGPYTPTVGGAMDYDAGAYAPLESPRPYSGRLASFHQLDLRLDKTWQFHAWQLSAYLDLQNAYNHQNVEAASNNYDYSQSSTISGLPILPVLGVRGEI